MKHPESVITEHGNRQQGIPPVLPFRPIQDLNKPSGKEDYKQSEYDGEKKRMEFQACLEVQMHKGDSRMSQPASRAWVTGNGSEWADHVSPQQEAVQKHVCDEDKHGDDESHPTAANMFFSCH